MKVIAFSRCLLLMACALLIGAEGPDAPGASSEVPEEDLSQEPDVSDGATLRFNFRDVPLDTVLDYLSEMAGFIIVREAKIEGRVDVVSYQPLNRDEAVVLLSTVLNERGYAAIRNERTLTIVKRDEAKQRDIPVRTGGLPESIPKTGEMVTQVIPLRHTDAVQLVETLKPLIPTYAVINANKSSNAIVLTDTQADVRRMAEIIRALDTSISAISEIKVFSLTYSKAADTAKLINTLFQPPSSQGAQSNNNAVRQFFARMRGGGDGGPGGGGPPPDLSDSAAKQAASRVQAVADERTNAVVVSAPGDLMPLIEEVIKETDRDSAPTTEVRVFNLKFADAGEMSQIINDAFGYSTTTASSGGQPTQRLFGGGRFGMGGFPGGGQNPQGNQQTMVNDTAHAVPDYRTNSVVVSAESVVMEQVARMVERLDDNPARDQKVFVYKLKNADGQGVAGVVQGMFSQQSGSTRRSTQSSTRSNTSQSGAAAGNTGSGMSSSGRASRRSQ